MVIDDQRRDRGQIILIAAVVIAFIVLGVVVVFNGVLYTETISSSSTSQSTADAELVDQELEAAVVDLALYANAGGSMSSDFEDVLEDELFDQYRETKVNSQPVLVDAGVDDVTSGTAGADLSSYNDETIVDSDEIGHFELELADDTGEVTIVANRSGSLEAITIEGISGSYDVDSPSGSCEIQSDTARVDLVTGSVSAPTDSDCEPALDPIEDGETYDDIELDAAVSDGSVYYESSNDDVLAVTLDVTYESSTVSYHDENREINVYGEQR
ncbi:DUF7261 family protein [Natrarchaeobaculum aegyptiacum]|uniref:Uncharacterized protein n=1 Tax=Natrarchaeobaculum aegyptiacum TaxID=745377 RepID=A0A2Z2HPL5_9EURY|nr:hypothetical protein [Natrarchaeobaculum aegyptiacum]ARS88872.1 hypothetical protein B1756_03285 [Natrarchaeobaculum aegyptiacum]